MALGKNTSEDNSKYNFVDRRKLLSNSRFNIYFDHLITQEGTNIEDFLIVKPKIYNHEDVIGVCVIPIFEDKFCLMKGWRHQFNDFIFQAPAGFIEKDESPSFSALRELSEEVSFQCNSNDLINLGTYVPDAGLIEGKVALFLAMNCKKKDEFSLNEIGTGNIISFSKQELQELINHESNIGGSTIVAALRALNFIYNKKKLSL